MLEAHAKIWTAALRSGKYKQGIGFLTLEFVKGPDVIVEYCCLGVACAIADQFGISLDSYVTKYSSVVAPAASAAAFGSAVVVHARRTIYGRQRAGDVLPKEMLSIIKTPIGEFTIYDVDGESESFSLVNLNDSDFTFNQIADVIDYFYEDL